MKMAFRINHVKLKRKRTRKCRGGRCKVKKIEVVATSRQQKPYSGQSGSNPENLIKLKLVSEPVRTLSHQYQHVSSHSVLDFLMQDQLVQMRNE